MYAEMLWLIFQMLKYKKFTECTLLWWSCWLIRGHSVAWGKVRPFFCWIYLKKGTLSVFESIYNWMCQQFLVLNCVSLLVIPLKWQLHLILFMKLNFPFNPNKYLKIFCPNQMLKISLSNHIYQDQSHFRKML